jgi:hypothetical protein
MRRHTSVLMPVRLHVGSEEAVVSPNVKLEAVVNDVTAWVENKREKTRK